MTVFAVVPAPRRPVADLERYARLRDHGFDTQQASLLTNAGYDIAEDVLFKPGGAR